VDGLLMRARRTLGIALLAALALLAAPVARAQWQTFEPGGDTACSDGSPYRFFALRGDPAKLLVEFEGGGACWSGLTCELDIYTRRITTDPERARQSGQLQGIYDRSNPENPFRDYTHVFVPYCTGDLHWGDVVKSYSGVQGPYTVRHKGAVNAAAALQWTSANVLAPQQLAVAGCSAGGYGATLWAAHLLARYPGARAAHLADSAAGVVPEGFFQTLQQSWNLSSAWPSFIPSLAPERLDAASFGIVDFYSGVAGHYPLAGFSQYNTLQDTTQVFFSGLMKGGLVTPQEWSSRMQEQLAAIRAANFNFSSYLAPGTQHCIINRPEFYTTQVGGVRFSEWVSRLLATGRPGSVP
jgi:hypothetical protein